VSPRRSAQVFVTLGFVAVIWSASVIQTATETHQGERPGALELFDHPPTAENLRAFEKDLEQRSLVANELRPWMQYAQFELLADAGEKAVVGRDGWLFYGPGIRAVTARAALTSSNKHADPFAAIKSWHDQLQARGIRLLVLPVPNKESVYPEMLSRRAEGHGVFVCRQTRVLLERLRAAGIIVVDLFELYRRAKQERNATDPDRFYLAQDSHWSPAGMQLAVQAVAREVIKLNWVEIGRVDYDERPATVERLGDLIQMLKVPQLERVIKPEYIVTRQVVRRDDGRLYQDVVDSRILIMGDSFLRIYEQDQPEAAGFVAHLARALKQPLTSIINEGGAATLVRQDLGRRPRSLANKGLVIWEFVERDILDATEGWPILPVPTTNSNRR
jgi:alginate O-acetyltransferase complex protein AlgJ